MPCRSCSVPSEQEAKLDQWLVWMGFGRGGGSPPGIEHRTAQPTTSHYSDYAIPDSSLSPHPIHTHSHMHAYIHSVSKLYSVLGTATVNCHVLNNYTVMLVVQKFII